jgi:hypothetical protein
MPEAARANGKTMISLKASDNFVNPQHGKSPARHDNPALHEKEPR